MAKRLAIPSETLPRSVSLFPLVAAFRSDLAQAWLCDAALLSVLATRSAAALKKTNVSSSLSFSSLVWAPVWVFR